jgi:hypothetical protein
MIGAIPLSERSAEMEANERLPLVKVGGRVLNLRYLVMAEDDTCPGVAPGTLRVHMAPSTLFNLAGQDARALKVILDGLARDR